MLPYNTKILRTPVTSDRLTSFFKFLVIPLLLLICFSGCTKWNRRSGSEIPKEIPVNSTVQENSSSAGENAEKEEKKDTPTSAANKNKEQKIKDAATDSAETISVVVSSADKSKEWKTNDEILAQNIAELLLIKNEEFNNPLDIRPYDFDVVIIDRKETKKNYHIWVNFIKENEVIVEDENAKQWNLSIVDSHALRKILKAFA